MTDPTIDKIDLFQTVFIIVRAKIIQELNNKTVNYLLSDNIHNDTRISLNGSWLRVSHVSQFVWKDSVGVLKDIILHIIAIRLISPFTVSSVFTL